MSSRISGAIAVLLALVSASPPAFAEGALAFGTPDDISKNGVAAGYAINQDSIEEAKKLALEECRKGKSAPKRTTDLCRVYETFKGRCFAFAIDPKGGTPGWGWHLADNLEDAKSIALQRCKATEGAARKGECRVTKNGCDEKK